MRPGHRLGVTRRRQRRANFESVEVDKGVAILDQAIGEVEAGEVSDEVLGEYAGF